MAASDEFLNIHTPENVAFGYEIVGIGSRFMAALVDSVIIGIVYLIVVLAMVFVLGNFVDDNSMVGSFVAGLFGLLGFLFIWGYYIFFEMMWNGGSPGKQMVGLRVIRRDGAPITLAESIIRNLVRLVDFLPFAYGAGVVTMFIDGQSRRLGDLAAGTLVVRDREDVTLESLASTTHHTAARGELTPANDIESLVMSWPLERLDEDDIHLVEEFLRRRSTMANGATLAGHIYQKLINKMEITDQGISPSYIRTLQCLEAIIRINRHHA